jgi:hypothetical protein
LAAAFLKEVCVGNSAKLWDHAAANDKLDNLKDEIHRLAAELGMKVRIDGFNVLRSVTSDNGRPPALVLQEDRTLVVREKLRSASVEMAALGVKEKDILAFVEKSLHEKVVDEVHEL